MEDNKIIKFPDLKFVKDDFAVEFGVDLPLLDEVDCKTDHQSKECSNELSEVNIAINSNHQIISELGEKINKLTSTADEIDYMVAVGSGILTGIIDAVWVGEFSFERGKTWSESKVNNFVKSIAKKNGYEGDSIEGAIRHLEKKYGAPSDSVTDKFGGGLQHHLRDFAHHMSPVGLMFSMLTQFTGKAYGTDTNGNFQIVEVRNRSLIGEDVPQKILYGTIFWFFHMVSDMAGSSSTPDSGTGLPGPIMSLLKEISALPFFSQVKNETGVGKLSLWISKMFNGTLFAKRDDHGKLIKESVQSMKFDFRGELGLSYELGRQALPVILNDCIVRSFYFIRRFREEIVKKDLKHLSEVDRLDWGYIKPIKNRTIVRMLTIATGTFTVIDMADAAIRGGIKSGGNPALFASEFLLRVNFVGVGRFVVAAGTDIAMEGKRIKLRNERLAIMSEQLHLMNAKIFYLQANAWRTAEQTEESINEAFRLMEQTSVYFIESWKANNKSLENIGILRDDIVIRNEGLLEELSDILKWG